MSIERWLKTAVDDAEARGLRELKPLLEGLAQSTALLRNANFNVHADDGRAVEAGPQASDSAPRPQLPTSQPVRRQAPRPGIRTVP